jgi:glycosyltransferase involved in cell wall biosynthesis
MSAEHRSRVLVSSRLGIAPPGAKVDLEGFCEEVRVVEPPPFRPRRRQTRVERLGAFASWALAGPSLEARSLEPLREGMGRVARTWTAEFDPEVLEINEALTLPLVGDLVQRVPVLLNVHNLVYRVAQRMSGRQGSWPSRLKARLNISKLRRFEREIYRRPFRFVTCSEADRQGLLELAPQARVSVVPNGVDTAHFHCALPDQGEPDRLLFTGKMEYIPNADAVEFFINEIMPRVRQARPAAHLEVVGMCPPQHLLDLAAGNPMTVHGEVPDVRPWLERCAISVVPLRAGSGTRLKILEALSMERAVVSTRIGAEGIDVVDGEHLLLADRPEEFADRVLALMEDEALRQRLGRNGRRLVEERYDWSRVAPLLSQAYTEAARGG